MKPSRLLILVALGGTAAAFASDTNAGPVGPLITASFQNVWQLDPETIVHAEALDAYFSVCADVSATGALKVRRIDPDSGTAGAPIEAGSTVGTWVDSPAISWNPRDRRFLLAYVPNGSSINGTILDETGAPLGSAGQFVIGPAGGGSLAPRIAFDGNDWLVVWEQPAATGAVQGRIVKGTSSNAAPAFGTVSFDIQADAASEEYAPNVGFGAGTDYLVVWTGKTDGTTNSGTAKLFGRTVSPSGTVGPLAEYHTLSTGLPNAGSGAVEAAIAANPDDGEFLIAWAQGQWGGNHDSMAVRVDAVGSPIGTPLPIAAGKVERDSMAAAYNSPGGQYLLSWLERSTPPGSMLVQVARLDASLTILDPGTTLHTNDSTGQWFQRLSSASRARDFQTIVQWATDEGGNHLEVQRYSVGVNPLSPFIPSVAQMKLDDVTPIPQGGIIIQGGLILEAPVLSSQPFRIEAEVREAGVPFSGVPTQVGGELPAGDASVRLEVASLEHGKAYHWQLRAVGATGKTLWVPFGADPDDADEEDFVIRPNVLPTSASPGQFRTSDGRPVAQGEAVYTTQGLLFKAGASDGDGDDVALDVEVRPLGVAFTGIPTASGPLSSIGTVEVVQAPEVGAGYHWQYRPRDSALGATAWISYGSNPEDEADFRLMGLGSTNLDAQCGLSAGFSRTRGAEGVLLLSGVLLLIRRRATGPHP